MTKYLLTTIPLAIFLLTMVPMVHAQVQQPGYQCSVCPQGQQPIPIQPQFIQPQQPVLAAAPPPQPSLTIENITTAITQALDPINKHLAVQDSEIANITTIITKLQAQPVPAPAPLPAPLPPPTTNSTQLPPPPPPGEQQSPPQSGSSCPSGGGPSGPGFNGGGPINQYFYPGGFGPHFGGNFGGSHSGGHHGGH